MPSITTWRRLEPRCRAADLRDALQAAVHDPFWMLARQWQLGEFRGTDGGSPIAARFRAEQSTPDRGVLGPAARPAATFVGHVDLTTTPLEAWVERETIHTATRSSLLVAAEEGLHFLRLLEQFNATDAARATFVATYGLTASADERLDADPGTRGFLLVMAGRVPDGNRLLPVLQQARPAAAGDAWRFPASLALSDRDVAACGTAGDAWLAWRERFSGEPSASERGAWNAERMEYEFALASRTSDGEVALTANGYRGGRLDWHDFDLSSSSSVGASALPQAVVRVGIPAPVTFRGMPAPRYWEFEDGQVDFGGLLVEPEDLGRLLLIEFALTYGNDWFLLPVELDAGAVYRRRSLVVTDTFGEQTLVRSYSEIDAQNSGWRMFHVADDAFFLAPTLPAALESAPVEEVLFARDEAANLAWAVEKTVESRIGRTLACDETEAQDQKAAPRPSRVYQLMSTVPQHWIALLPEKTGATAIRLRPSTVVQPDGSPGPAPIGRILTAPTPLSIPEEEIPRGGLRVTCAYQYARWSDGSTHVWIGRRKHVGHRAQPSALRFDFVTED